MIISKLNETLLKRKDEEIDIFLQMVQSGEQLQGGQTLGFDALDKGKDHQMIELDHVGLHPLGSVHSNGCEDATIAPRSKLKCSALARVGSPIRPASSWW